MDIISKRQKILISLLPGGILLTWLFSHTPDLVEKFYSQGIYPVLGQALSILTNRLIFSLTEALLVIIILALVYLVIKHCTLGRKSSSTRVALIQKAVGFWVFLSLAYFIFLFIWGFNYYRIPFADLAGFDTSGIRAEELELLCSDLVQQTNELRLAVSEDNGGVIAVDKTKVLEQAWEGYSVAGQTYAELGGNYSKPKALVMSRIMSWLGLSGLYFPFTGEANVNMEMPVPLFPATVAHEMAHQRGFAREDEANFIAYLTCINHPDLHFQYSGTLLALINSMNALAAYNYETYLELRQGYAAGVERDLSALRQFWQQYQGPISRTSSRVNNAYLQINGQEDGIHSYGRMVDLLIVEKRTQRP